MIAIFAAITISAAAWVAVLLQTHQLSGRLNIQAHLLAEIADLIADSYKPARNCPHLHIVSKTPADKRTGLKAFLQRLHTRHLRQPPSGR